MSEERTGDDEQPTRRRDGDRRGGDDRRHDEPPPKHRRYEPRGVAGIGGNGVVFRVLDLELGREVALKTLHAAKVSSEAVERFVAEARATAGLEHPNIVPLYDVGLLDDGRPFYTMRLLPGRSLADVLGGLAAADDPEWSVVRLLQVVQQAALALEFAHERGVVHRDVKPGNVMLGEHGEVLLVDWGIAKCATSGRDTTTGVLQGTLHFMSPEQACGEKVDARTDVYALGVTLYQCLTLRLPFEGTQGAALVAAILRDAPPRMQDVGARIVPAELVSLVDRAMAKRREDRLPSAKALHDEIQDFVEGVRDRARKVAAAETFRVEGEQALRTRESTEAEIEALDAEIARLESVHPPWQPVSEKRALVEARRRRETLQDRALAEFLAGVHRLAESLAHVPDHAPSRRVLADVFWERFREAERHLDRPLAQVYRSLLERFHDGRYARELDGAGSLRIDVFPKHAELTLHPQVERDVVLVDGPGTPLGRGDVRISELAMGSYVVVARAEGHEPARYPVAIFRNTDWDGELRLLPEGSIPDGFVYVPGTWTWLGGDDKATNSWPLRRTWVDSFLIQRHPVTFGEWCEFLDAVGAHKDSPLVPSCDAGELCTQSGRWKPNPLHVWGANNGTPPEDAWFDRIAVLGIDQESARARAGWLERKVGICVGLVDELQWELAARGADRRTYPWGWAFDLSLCHLRDSLQKANVLPVESFQSDCSVYGVRDMGGGVQEITRSWFDERRGLLVVKGGGWQVGPPIARSAWRGTASAATRNVALGHRYAIEIKA